MQKWISNLGSAALALLIAFLIWVTAVNEQNPPRETDFPREIPIELQNPPEGFALAQPLEQMARVRVRIPESSWNRLQTGDVRAFVDLSDAKVGLNEYEVHVEFADKNIVKLAVSPPRVTLRLEALREKRLPVSLSVSDDPPVGYIVSATQATPAFVQISGIQSRVEQVVDVAAVLALRGAKSGFEREVTLVARDAQGNVVSGVKLMPQNALVKLVVEQRTGFKDVAVRVVMQGDVPSGYWLSNFSVQPNTITLVGNPILLDSIGGFVPTEPIDLREARTSFTRRVDFVLPPGITPLSATQSTLVTIDISPIIGGQTIQRQVVTRGLERGLQAVVSPETVDVILSGPLLVLQTLKLEDVQVVLDLTQANQSVGKYRLSPMVRKPDSLKIERLVPDVLEVAINNTGSLTISRPITFTGLTRGLRVAYLPDAVELKVSGSFSILQNLTTEAVQASLDLTGKTVGRHRIPVTISKPDGVTVEMVMPDAIEVIISR